MHVRYDEGSGPVVVLLHGQPGSASDWQRVVPLIRAAGFRVLALDRPGYAGSKRPAASWRENARLLLDRVADRVDSPATLVGWSWAGGVVLEAARLAPSRVRAMVLIGSVGHELAVGPADRLLAAPGIRGLYAPVMNRLATRGTALLASTSGSVLDSAATAFFTAEASLWPATGACTAAAAEQVTMVRDAPELSLALPSIDVAATVVHGWRDSYVSIRAGAALAAALPRSTFEPLEGGHLLPFELPEAVADAICRAASREGCGLRRWEGHGHACSRDERFR